MRHQARIFKTIQNYILKPYLWCAETQALGDICRVRKPEVAARIEAYLDEADVERWKAEARQMMISRARAWREEYMNVPRPSKEQVMLQDDASILHARSEARQQMSVAVATLSDPRAAKRWRNNPEHHGDTTQTPRKSMTFSKNFATMNRVRLDSKERDEIARKVLLRMIDFWWNSFCFYQAQAGRSRKDWINWRREVLRHGSLDSRAPDPPEVLVYPEISFAQAYTWLQKEVEYRLRDRQDSNVLMDFL